MAARTRAKAAKREEIRLAWADSVPWSIRGRLDLPLATWAVLGMLIARAGCPGDCPGEEWRAELSLTEMQRRLGGAGRKTVAGAVARLERAGFVRAIRRRRNPRFLGGQHLYPRAPGGRQGGRAGGTWPREEEAGWSLSRWPPGLRRRLRRAPEGRRSAQRRPGPRGASPREFTRFQQFTQGDS